jgi:hypothetical protein
MRNFFYLCKKSLTWARPVAPPKMALLVKFFYNVIISVRVFRVVSVDQNKARIKMQHSEKNKEQRQRISPLSYIYYTAEKFTCQ